MSEFTPSATARATTRSRRAVLKLGAGAGAALGVTRRLPASAKQATPAATAGERPLLRVGVPSLVPGLDPHLDPRNQRMAVAYSIFDSVLERDYRGGNPPGTGSRSGPMLATAWEAEDETTLRLDLRPGVTFHDGSSLTADDVRFTFERLRDDPTGEFERARGMLGDETTVEVVDPQTLRLRTPAPDPLLEKRLATWAAMVVPRAHVERVGPEAFAQEPVGTGPYRFVEFRPDDALVLEAHDGWWGGVPPASRIEFRVLPEVAARIAALASGEVDLVSEVPPDQISTLESTDGVEVRSVPQAAVAILYYNTNHPTIADKRMRQALNLAIDRQVLVDALWQGRAEVPRSFQFPAWGELYDETGPTPPFDPERARSLIAAAGYDGEPVGFRISTATYTLGEQVAQAVVEMWRGVGLNAEVVPMQPTDFWTDPERSLVTMAVNNDEFADPVSFWLRLYAGSNPGTHWWTNETNERFTDLGIELQQTLDADARRAATREMLDIYADEAPGTVLYVPTQNYGVRRGVDWLPYSFFYMDFRPTNLAFAGG